MTLALAGRERLGDGADVLVGDVDHAALERLVALAVDLADDDLGPAHLQLVALAAHRLDEHRELQLAAAGDLDAHRATRCRSSSDRHVAEHLAVEPFAEVPRGDVACRPCRTSGEVFTPKVMRSTGSSTVRRGQRRGVVRVGERVADLDLGEPGDDEQIAGGALVDLDAADALERHELRELALQRRHRDAVVADLGLLLAQRDLLAPAQRAFDDPADGEPAEVVGRVEVGDERLQRRRRGRPAAPGSCRRSVEQRREVVVVRPGMPTPVIERPSRAMAEMTGNSMWWSAASRSKNSW